MAEESRGPLADITVLALEQFGAGPYGTLQLADLGATVIKIEDPGAGGDASRYVPPYQQGSDGVYYEALNAGKRSVALDLRTDAGRAVFEDLVPHADAIVANLRGNQAEKLGLTYEALRHRNKRIVCAVLSGFGSTGPRAAEPAYDYVLQAMSGWMSLTGEPDGPPMKSGLSLVDLSGGYVLALTVLAAVWQARRDDIGSDCDLSLFEVALSLLNYVASWSATRGYVPERRGESAHPSIVPFQAFRAADGWFTVACPKQKFWVSLCEAIGMEELLDDPRFADGGARFDHRDDLLPLLRARFLEAGSEEWVRRLGEAGVPVGRVNTVAEALADPQVAAREGMVEYEHPRLGAIRQVASPLRIGDADRARRPASGLGEDNEDLLRDLCDYDAELYAQLRAEGAFGAS
jgi:crotonobetainyl-CoA:carnitine CoA-transferase CaiB-like acyl-CoA transferase